MRKQKLFKNVLALTLVGIIATGINTTTFAAETNEMVAISSSIIYNMNTPSYDDTLITISNQLRTLKQNGASDDELNSYAKLSLQRARYDLDGYIDNLLNSQEQALYDSNVAKGLLCMANGKFATDYAKSNYSSGLHNGNGDAFRHTIWNYGMVIDVGYDFAKKWSTAHEDGGTGPALEKQMDLFNNSVGLTLGCV